MTKTVKILLSMIVLGSFPLAFADSDEQLGFAGAIEETLGHFWALEQNLDSKNADLALVHATHPISELYDTMKPQLQAADPELDSQVQTTLMELQNKATTKVSRQQAQQAIDDAKSVIEDARQAVVEDELNQDPLFKIQLMKGLLETSIVEYGEAVSDGTIHEMAEFQDGSAFVWRSQQIFDEIKSDIDSEEAEEIEELFEDIQNAYDKQASPSEVETITDGIIHEIDEILGVDGEESSLEMYFENIYELLDSTKQEYNQGSTDVALSHATKAYLDNFEFVEGPLKQKDPNLMEEIEIMLREELRSMIKSNESSADVSAHIDNILTKLSIAENLLFEPDILSMSPLKQVQNKIDPSNVQCSKGLTLIMKATDGSPACVSPSTADKLILRGWGQEF